MKSLNNISKKPNTYTDLRPIIKANIINNNKLVYNITSKANNIINILIPNIIFRTKKGRLLILSIKANFK